MLRRHRLFALVLLIGLLVGLALVPVFGMGMPVVARVLGATRALADLHRREAGRVPGTVIPAPRRPQQGAGWRGVLVALRDLQTAREILRLGAQGVGGTAVGGLAYLAVTPLVLFTLETGPQTLLRAPVWVLLLVIWWTVPRLQRVLALLARTLLGRPTRRSPPASSSSRRRGQPRSTPRRPSCVERDLHDGAQARLAAVGMTLGLAAQALQTDPRAGELLEEGRADAGWALAELRDLVRGIHPPVLADRGLVGGLEAAALLCPVPVTVEVDLPARPEAPVESALYFDATEALTNITRHAQAARA